MLLRRLLGSARSAAWERAMAEELELHLEMETELLVARGMDPAAARVEARRRFGSVANIEDECRDSWGLRVVEAFVHDVRYSARTLLTRQRGHAAVVVLTLALGIGANAAIFSVVHAVLLRSLPYTSGDALVEIRQQATGIGVDNVGLSAPELADYRRGATSLDALVEYHQMGFNLLDATQRNASSRVVTGVVSADFFDMIGIRPLLGRSFRAEDDRRDAAPVLIVSYPFWRNELGGDPNIIGRTFEMNDRVHTVVGVLPPVPQYPNDNDVYMPVSACPFRNAPHMDSDRNMRMVTALARIRTGTSLDAVDRDVAAVASRMASAHPDVYEPTDGFGATALSVRDQLTRRARPTLLLLLAATGFVLLIVCANVANLTLARLRDRERELAVRSALGAGRGRLARQLLTEALLLAAFGGALGLALASVSMDLLVAFAARLTPRAAEITLDRPVLLFTIGVTVATALLFGVLPAMRASRPEAPARTTRARQALVVAQVAISFVLLIAAGLMVRGFINLVRADAGFQTDHVFTARVDLDWVKYDSPEKRRRFFRPLLAKLQAQTGVTHAALSLTFPLNTSTPFSTDFIVEGPSRGPEQPRPLGDFRLVSPDYFDAIGMKLLTGRSFIASDSAGSAPVGIVNLSMARHQFGSAAPIGRRFSLDGGRTWTSIVGVVNDVKQYGLETAPVDELYLPFDQRGPLAATILVRTSGDPSAMSQIVTAAVRDVDPLQPVSRPQTLDQVKHVSLSSPRLTMQLVSLLAVLALVVTAIGIAGVVACAVNQRTFEIGVRMALGAPRASVVRMVVRQGLQPVAAGIVCGMAAALVITPSVAQLLYRVQPTDAATYAAVAAALAAAAAVASFAPARRAATVDPSRVLRAD